MNHVASTAGDSPFDAPAGSTSVPSQPLERIDNTHSVRAIEVMLEGNVSILPARGSGHYSAITGLVRKDLSSGAPIGEILPARRPSKSARERRHWFGAPRSFSATASIAAT
jgi:hypothetical protein